MDSLNNKTCIICGKQYKYCPNCAEFVNQPTWRALCDTDNCHTIFRIVTDYHFGIYDDDSAKIALKDCDLSVVKDKGTKEFLNNLFSTTPDDLKEEVKEDVKDTADVEPAVISETKDIVSADTEDKKENEKTVVKDKTETTHDYVEEKMKKDLNEFKNIKKNKPFKKF